MEKHQAIIAAAREWITDREPKDEAERALMLAVLTAFPEDFHTRESCGCGEAETCDECLPASSIPAVLESLQPRV